MPEPFVPFPLKMPRALKQAARRAASDQGVTSSTFARMALREKIARHELDKVRATRERRITSTK